MGGSGLTPIDTGLNAIVEMIRLAVFDITDDQPGKIRIEILLQLRKLSYLRRFGSSSCSGPVGGTALDGTPRHLVCLEAGGCVACGGKLCLQGFDLRLRGCELRARLVCLSLELCHFCIPLVQLLLQCAALRAQGSLRFQLGSK